MDAGLLTDIDLYNILAHELAHILLNDSGHLNPQVGTNAVRLMSYPYNHWVRGVPGTIYDSRRFDLAEAQSIATTRQGDLLRKV